MKVNLSHEQRFSIGGLAPLFFVLLPHLYFTFPVVNLLFFFIGYCWVLILYSPYSRVKVQAKRFRFSFVRILYLLDDFLSRIFQRSEKAYYVMIRRALAPLVFCTVLTRISLEGNELYCLIGCLGVEMVIRLFKLTGR